MGKTVEYSSRKENGTTKPKRSEPGMRSFLFEKYLKATIPRKFGKKKRQRMEKGAHVFLAAAVEIATEKLLEASLQEVGDKGHIVRDEHLVEVLSKRPFVEMRGFERAACVGGLVDSSGLRDLKARKDIIQGGADPKHSLSKRRKNRYKRQREAGEEFQDAQEGEEDEEEEEEEEEDSDEEASDTSDSESEEEEEEEKKKKKKSSKKSPPKSSKKKEEKTKKEREKKSSSSKTPDSNKKKGVSHPSKKKK